jgi:hypothetical protein
MRSALPAKPRDFQGLAEWSDLASQSSPPRFNRGLRSFIWRPSVTWPPLLFLRPGRSKGLTRETIPPVSPFGVQGHRLEGEPDPYYGHGGRFGKGSGGEVRKGPQESLND